MKTFYIPHKLKVGDITHLADNDSEVVITNSILDIENLVKIESPDSVFNAIVTDISKSSVEVEILEKTGNRKDSEVKEDVVLIQAISSENKFSYVLEKAVEIGVSRIIPVQSKYSTVDIKKFNKNIGLYEKIIADATEQSRNPHPTILDRAINISNLKSMNLDADIKICLATEQVEVESLEDVLKNSFKSSIIAVGPESGWSSSDLEVFNELNFRYVKLKGNILRTETAPLVMAPILKYRMGKI